MLLITLFSTTVNAQIKLSVNNEEIDFKGDEPTLINDRTYVPVRFLAEALGAEVDWDDTHKVVIIKNYGIEGRDTGATHYLRLGENKMVVYGYRKDDTIPGNNTVKGAETSVSFYFPEDIYPMGAVCQIRDLANSTAIEKAPLSHNFSQYHFKRSFAESTRNTGHSEYCKKK